MLTMFIDGKAVAAAEGATILKTAEAAGISIPHFCYHPAFPAGRSCRMCLVEIEGQPRLELACTTLVRDGMRVSTRGGQVMEARRGVLEFLLSKHPLDCPICDKAGECKLQDYSVEYGLVPGYFHEAGQKREKLVRIGERLVLRRKRCILCMRCIRFLDLVSGTSDHGVADRGKQCEITGYESLLNDTIYAGNLNELCPVGAITATEFRFQTSARFLEGRESLCVRCSRGCNIWMDIHTGFERVHQEKRVYRLRPRPNPEVNQYWMCDIGRATYTASDEGRQESLFMPRDGREMRMSWDKALIMIAEKIKAHREFRKLDRMAVVLTTDLTNEEIFLAARIFRKGLNLKNVFFADPPARKPDGFLFTGEMTANPRGAREIGFNPAPFGLGSLAETTDLVIIFGTHLAEVAQQATLERVFSRIATKALFVSCASLLDNLMDIVLPTAVVAEKDGSLTNVEGRLQKFKGILEPPGESLAEWNILARLGRELGLVGDIFGSADDLETIRRVMKAEIPFFRSLD
jgi:NADH-quinone oxidoreductase subunit G